MIDSKNWPDAINMINVALRVLQQYDEIDDTKKIIWEWNYFSVK